jgi:hypothetical protein
MSESQPDFATYILPVRFPAALPPPTPPSSCSTYIPCHTHVDGIHHTGAAAHRRNTSQRLLEETQGGHGTEHHEALTTVIVATICRQAQAGVSHYCIQCAQDRSTRTTGSGRMAMTGRQTGRGTQPGLQAACASRREAERVAIHEQERLRWRCTTCSRRRQRCQWTLFAFSSRSLQLLSNGSSRADTVESSRLLTDL